MAEIGFNRSDVETEVNHIIELADKVDKDAQALVNAAREISDRGIQGADWYTGTVQSMLNKLTNNKVSEAVAEIKLQAQKLVAISEVQATMVADNQ